MAELRPLRAWRYDPARVGDLAAVVAPPYDVISSEVVGRLYARSPYNVVRLILNREKDPHGAAACALRAWRDDGILVEDPTPAFYYYSQVFEVPRRGRVRRDGLMGVMRLERFESGRVLPHERTLAAPKADRLALLRACRANLDPIFGLVACPGVAFDALLGQALREPPIAEITADSVEHRMWRIGAPDLVARCGAAVGDRPVLIADGHHRYETALAFRDEMRAACPAAGPSAPFEFVLTYLCNSEAPGLLILPTHRILPRARSAEIRAALAALDDLFAVRSFPVAERNRFIASVVEGGGDIGCALPDALLVLTLRPGGVERMARHAPVTRRLAVVVLHEIVFPALPPGAATDLVFTHDDEEALDAVAGGRAGAAFLVPAPSADEVRAVAVAGETLPQKSTYFHPKLLTGLLIHSLAE